jgi:hypothetical protein
MHVGFGEGIAMKKFSIEASSEAEKLFLEQAKVMFYEVIVRPETCRTEACSIARN